MMVATFVMSPSLRTEVNKSAAFRNWSFGIPVIRSTVSGVCREYCRLSNWNTQCGCWRVRSYATLNGREGGADGPSGWPGVHSGASPEHDAAPHLVPEAPTA